MSRVLIAHGGGRNPYETLMDFTTVHLYKSRATTQCGRIVVPESMVVMWDGTWKSLPFGIDEPGWLKDHPEAKFCEDCVAHKDRIIHYTIEESNRRLLNATFDGDSQIVDKIEQEQYCDVEPCIPNENPCAADPIPAYTDRVYVTAKGATYHDGFNHQEKWTESFSVASLAVDMGYRPCKRCYPNG